MLTCLLFAFLSAYALTWAARFAAPYCGMVDKPDGERKKHRRPVPTMGGVAVYLGILLTLAASRFWDIGPQGTEEFASFYWLFALSGGLFCLLGVCDDRWPMRASHKFALQIVASLPFVLWGTSVETVELLGVQLELDWMGRLFTVFWLVSCANVVNLIDGLDGLAGSIGVVSSLTLFGLSLLVGNDASSCLSLIVAGATLGFLVHNWPPAKIFLGDAGSLTLGFAIGALSLQTSLKGATAMTLVVPLVVMSVPIFDTIAAILRRTLTGRGIGEPDRGHIHFHLQEKGLTGFQTLLAVIGLCLVTAGAAIGSTWLNNEWVAVASCVATFVLVIATKLFGYNEAVLVFNHVQGIHAIAKEFSGRLGARSFAQRARVGVEQGSRELRDEMIRRLDRLGTHSLDIVSFAASSGNAQPAFHWKKSEITANEDWFIQFDLRTDDDNRVSVLARGQAVNEQSRSSQRLVEVAQVLDTLCRPGMVDSLRGDSAFRVQAATDDSHENESGDREAARADDLRAA